QLAQDMLDYQVKKYIGAYSAAMGGLDCVVFTGGIGENDADLRAHVCENMEYLGIAIDPEKNKLRGLDINDISAEGSRVKVLVVCTNEELMIARDTKALVEAR
ncbi:MAG TPA: acetate kinase, partial [Candidatus Ruthenibacterium merdigallinarum]|nr:acetate kinase [Candidatus Ruthenibacterium merdigallinarum]